METVCVEVRIQRMESIPGRAVGMVTIRKGLFPLYTEDEFIVS